MTRIPYTVLLPVLTVLNFSTVFAQDPDTSRKSPPSSAVPEPKGGIATAATGDFDLARGTEDQRERIVSIIPRWERWQMHWTPRDLQNYTSQLDFFRIELAVAAGGKPSLEYVSNLSKPHPDVREGIRRDEKRLCMKWTSKGGKPADYDKQIMA